MLARAARRVASIALVCTCVGAPTSDAFAQTTAASGAAQAQMDIPLSELPEVPRINLRPPTKDEQAALDTLLDAVASPDAAERERARRSLLEVNRELVPAIARRIDTIADSSSRREMDRLLDRIRDEARDAVRAQMKARGEKGSVETPDYLTMLTEHAHPDDENWDPLVRVVAMSRMLAQIGTMPALRELVRVRVRYEFLRRDVQLLLEALGDRSLAVLIETLEHPAKSVSRWAARRLDLRGKAIPSETVQTDDLAVLSDVLRAYGRIRDPDAARVIISFSNSERAQVRLAARQAVRMLGEVANWQLRDTYENIVGKRPPREWSWERTARELFTEFDRLRLARVQRLFETGKKAHSTGNLDEAVEAFDQVLVRSPRFEHANEMVRAYLAFARAHVDDAPAEARRALARAQRLSGDDPERKPIESLSMTLEAEALLERKIADQVLLRRALELDPTNARAQTLLDRIQRGDIEQRTSFNRHIAAGTIATVAFFAVAFILWRRPRTEDPSHGPDAIGTDKKASTAKRKKPEDATNEEGSSVDPGQEPDDERNRKPSDPGKARDDQGPAPSKEPESERNGQRGGEVDSDEPPPPERTS